VDSAQVLDIGCGGGFLSNELAKKGFAVTGIDLSTNSLKIAAHHDLTHQVHYQRGDATHLPFNDALFDAVTCMDFLEHVTTPGQVISEASRVLKPGGCFLFHTFNRNFLSWLVVIQFVEWFVRNTPKNLHVSQLFITPQEIQKYLNASGLTPVSMVGIQPKLSSIDFKSLMSRVVPSNFEFRFTKSLLISYLGSAKKD
jgi:2-polyprenyl-6-hydroxyphenyl methylase/3-demethylubiquinone-9 3-methyltransferase